jgi:Type I restriction enzyme R protein N terminus (HSDR_N)
LHDDVASCKIKVFAAVMIHINYPKYDFRFRGEEGKEEIFDPLRKSWVRLTPEEWVRQNFLQFLIQECKYPAALIAVEKEVVVGELKKRFDLLLYSAAHVPWMLVEAKAPDVPLSENTLLQVIRYHSTLQADYLVVTNGTDTALFKVMERGVEEMYEFPEFGQ